jgi:hypothetical protein
MTKEDSKDSENESADPLQAANSRSMTTQRPADLGRLPSATASIFTKFTKWQVVLAIAIAAVSDLLGAFVTVAPPLVWAVDFVTALLLFAVLGWQWMLLPGLVMEAIPGLGVIPFWLLVVAGVLIWGTARPKFKRQLMADARDVPPARGGTGERT